MSARDNSASVGISMGSAVAMIFVLQPQPFHPVGVRTRRVYLVLRPVSSHLEMPKWRSRRSPFKSAPGKVSRDDGAL